MDAHLFWVLVAVLRLSQVATDGDCSLVVVQLLSVVASLVGEHKLQGMWASAFAARGLNRTAACQASLSMESSRPEYWHG